MPALGAASALRTEHEIAVHRYRHQPLEDHTRRSGGPVAKGTKTYLLSARG